MYLLRLARHWFFVKLFFVLFFVSTRTIEKQESPEEINQGITWPNTSLCTNSQPICINDNFEISKHCCLEEQIWDVSPISKNLQESISSPCPDGAIQKENVCIMVLQSDYPAKCPYEDNLPFNDYVKYVDLTVLPIWLPVKRDRGPYGEGIFYWNEASKNYKDYYSELYHYNNSLLNKSCIIFYNASYTEAVDCSDIHTATCAYTVLTSRTKSFCSQIFDDASCKQSDYSAQSKCFCQRTETNQQVNKIELKVPYQNLLYSSLEEACYIGLEKRDGSYIWTNSNTPINYTYWSPNSVFGEEYIFGAMSSDGWLLRRTEDEDNCSLIEKSIPDVEAKLSLNLMPDGLNLVAIPENVSYWKQNEDSSNPLIFCFSDGYNDTIIQKIAVERVVLDSTVGFDFPLLDNGPSAYWCEGFSYPHVKPIKSNVYFERSSYQEFVAILQTSYASSENPLTQSFIQEKYNLFVQDLATTEDAVCKQFYPRIYKIEVNESDLNVTLNFHLTTKTNNDSNAYVSLMTQMGKLAHFSLGTNLLYYTSSCIGLQVTFGGHRFTWSSTPVGEVVYRPVENWCMDRQGIAIIRTCEGNFIDGANWSHLREDCVIPQDFTPTVIFSGILELNSGNPYMSLVTEVLLTRTEELDMFDIHLVSEFFERLSESEQVVDIQNFAKLIEAVLNVEENLLMESQKNYNSTDKILGSIKDVLEKSNLENSITTDSISIISLSIDDFYSNSIFWRKTENGIEVDYVNLTEVDNQYYDYPTEFDSGLIFDKNLLNEIVNINNSRIIIVAYFTSKLFNEDYPRSTIQSTIFSTIFPNLPDLNTTDLDNLIITVYNGPYDLDNQNMFNCSYWTKNPNNEKGYWYHKSEGLLVETKILCNFKRFTNVGLVSAHNITYLLEALEFNNQTACHLSLDRTAELLSNYSTEFQAKDIDIITKILLECSKYTEIQGIANVFDIIIELPVNTLQNYNKDYKLDLINDVFNEIFRTIDDNVHRKNFAVSVVDFSLENISGFHVKRCENSCLIIVDEEKNEETDFEINVQINDALIKQLKEELRINKIAFVVFSNNALFVTEQVSKLEGRTKIVGILTEQVEQVELLNGNVDVSFDIVENSNDHSCDFWFTGYWNQEESVVELNNIYDCVFWRMGYYSLRYNNINVTVLLNEVLGSDLSTVDTLNKFLNIATMFSNIFQALDVDIVATYLSNIKDADSDDNILNTCVDIISTFMHFKEIVLEESETKFSSTSKLIKSLENVAKQITREKFKCTSQMLILVSYIDLPDPLITVGIELKDIKNPCEFNKLIGVDVDQESDGSGVILNRVKSQPIIYTVYLDNVLFNEKDARKNTSIIFGVHIPDYNEFLSKDITVFYDINSITSEDSGCLQWKFTDDNQNIFGSWELTSPLSKNSTCNYYNQGYYTVWEINEDIITATLMDIYQSDEVYETKLERLQKISNFYEIFGDTDVFLLSQVLLLGHENYYDLFILKRIILNYFKIPSSVKQASQINHNATSQILDFLHQNKMSSDANEPVSLENYFQSIFCFLNETDNAITISKNRLNCLSVTNSEIQLEFSKLKSKSEVISVSMFSENDIFVDQDGSQTSKILGINLPEGVAVNIRYDSNVNTQKYCAYWEFTPKENGNWVYWTTNKTTNETICTFYYKQDIQYVAVVEQSITKALESISLQKNYDDRIFFIKNAVSIFKSQLQPNHIDQIYQILQTDGPIEDAALIGVVRIIDILMGLDRNILVTAQKLFNATENLLFCIDNLILQFKGEIELTNFTNFALVVTSNISGLVFEQKNDATYKIKDILYEDDEGNQEISNTTLIIDEDLRNELKETSSKLYVSVYFNNAFFNGKNDNIIRDQGIIVGVGISNASLSQHLKMYFKNFQNQTNICGYWTHSNLQDDQTGYWETITKNPCENRMDARYFALLEEYNFNGNNITSDLQEVLDSDESLDNKLEQVVNIVQNNSYDLEPIDVYIISQILDHLRNNNNTTKSQVDLTSQIISDLFLVNRTVLQLAQNLYGATDRLIFSADEIIKKCADEVEDPIIYSNFTASKTDVKSGNISSIIFSDCTSSACKISFVNEDNFTQVAEDGNFKTALVFSPQLLMQIKENTEPVYLIITVYFHDNLFNENPKREMDTSKVLGVILEGLNVDIQGTVYFFYNIDNVNSYISRSCAYWKYEVSDVPLQGSWQADVSPQSKNGYTVCEYDHLTHFVLLLASSSSMVDQLNQSQILDIITNINSILSLLGVFGIFLTTVLFDRWRHKTGNQILINFSVSISIKNVMLYISDGIYTEGDKSMACTITGGILHYSILSEFCWMLIIAILQFKRFVEVLGGPLKYVLLKSCICGWVFPALPVFLIIIVDINNYNKSDIGLCYPSGFGLYLGVWLPLLVIISINFVIFVFILYNVFHKKTEYRDQVNHEIIFQWRLAILLFSMLGLTWSFGFLALAFQSGFFAILFTFLATLQGFIMFLFFIVFNKNTRYLYVQLFKSWMYSNGYKSRLN